MNKTIPSLLAALLLLGHTLPAQLTIGSGTSIKSDNNSYLVLNDLGIAHNATAIEPTIKFTGSATSTITGTGNATLTRLELAMQNNATVQLQYSIQVSQSIRFDGGMLDLNNRNIQLLSGAQLLNESSTSHVSGANGGLLMITVALNTPSAVNPGNLGLEITSAANLGNVQIARGHKSFPINGSNSITRYYTITPTFNQQLNATVRFYYFDAELNGRPEEMLGLWSSGNGGNSFQSVQYTGRSAGLNYVEKTGIDQLSTFTLFDAASILPVSDLQFTAQRTNSSQVRLDWKTATEHDNKGFHIERKLEQESNFTTLGFVPSLATGGNSSQPLAYTRTDNNNFTGRSYYRLKQEDINGQAVWSVVRIVTGINNKTVVLKAWPIPAIGNFYVNVEGIEKDVLMVYDMTGKLKLQLPISGNTQHQVTQLTAGTYLLKLAGQKDIQQKIIVQ
ncbi:T9SS type A sorting domain-containing protein [Paraflavitalea sp. CAU 1676]|uniref:T9SS type A sorting domain-containing protein n=1 Tax=Paraflavitalea sp. CAU 1676 TaxID=3032598 RepID=UPI0023DA87C4|nr:T9SS type A sorting domain-containing protein [Paraflavitalea sp. CAU 1676]MDF2188747.1 T9SS type A sorting domain-containing protein [Paraflavitalea sp. CAU 1676]